MKYCRNCKSAKPFAAFPRNRTTKDGYMDLCRPCHNTVTRESVIKHHGSTRNKALKRRYNIDETTVEWLKLQQGRVCALCREGTPAHVDHDHLTGEVRGILCFNCNRALGYVGDDLTKLYSLADYLEAHQP